MRIGIGLPNPVPGTAGRDLIEWARRAEGRGFDSLSTIDRIVYPSYESLVALAGVAAATERVGLMTNVLLEPTRNPVLLAKEAASVDQLSNGRLTLGLGVGARPDDYTLAEREFRTRGRRFDQDLELMHRVWRGEVLPDTDNAVGPAPVNGDRVPVLIGGMNDRAIERTIRWGVGWTVGGAPPEVGGPFADRVREAWTEAGREGSPLIVGLTYFGLGANARDVATAYLTDYYGDFGPQIAGRIPLSGDGIQDMIGRFESFGFDLVYFDPTTNDVDEVDRLADAALG
jgi:alkanesulfonate monooxygenase SsuD/methylene tetrahydromethanopterin reductase-like flavin-dependent oxidoreductase (luciferase family)